MFQIFEGVFTLIRSGARVPLAKWAASTITLYINHQSHSSKDLGVLLHMVYTKQHFENMESGRFFLRWIESFLNVGHIEGTQQ